MTIEIVKASFPLLLACVDSTREEARAMSGHRGVDGLVRALGAPRLLPVAAALQVHALVEPGVRE